MSRLLNRLADIVLDLPRVAKRVIVVAADAGLCVLAVWLAFYLRLDAFLPFLNGFYSPELAAAVGFVGYSYFC